MIARMKTSGMYRWIGAGALLSTVLAGCTSPLSRTTEQELRDNLIASNRAYYNAVSGNAPVELTRKPSDVEKELTDQRKAELDRMGGPTSYGDTKPEYGVDLGGKDAAPTLGMSLQRAIHLAVKHNIEIQQARLLPAVTQAQITQAEAVFDAVFFTNVNWTTGEQARPPSLLSTFGGAQSSETAQLSTGIKKILSTGGQITAQTDFSRNYSNPSIYSVDTYWASDVALTLNQPLLRNFGSEVSLSQIVLARNARKQANADLHKTIMDVASATERAYWDLALARHRLLIQNRLLKRVMDDRDKLVAREQFDVSPVRKTEANSFVEIRRSDVIRARAAVRQSSDNLKRLIGSPELPLAAETLIEPLDTPADVPVTYNLVDAVSAAIRKRPELVKALSQIDDASVRQTVADNGRLPILNLLATLKYNGQGSSLERAYSKVTDADYIEYVIGGQFEMPIGNRSQEAAYQQRVIERRAAVSNYQKVAQDVVLDLKSSLRTVMTTYELIGVTRNARRAAADALRALEEQEKAGVAMTPEFLLDLKLRTQERLADAESQEVQALTDYNTAIARFYQAMGTLLERNGIEFDPDEPDTK